MVSAVPRSRHVELTAPGTEFLRHLAQTLGARLLAHLVRDAHGAELRPAHRAEVRELVALLRQRRIVEGAGGLGIERQVELVLPAEIEARAGERVVARARSGVSLGEIDRKSTRLNSSH